MKLLPDTHVLLWSLPEPDRLSKRIAPELRRFSNEPGFSPTTTWEVMMLAWKGRTVPDADSMARKRDALREILFREAAINHEVAMRSGILNLLFKIR